MRDPLRAGDRDRIADIERLCLAARHAVCARKGDRGAFRRRRPARSPRMCRRRSRLPSAPYAARPQRKWASPLRLRSTANASPSSTRSWAEVVQVRPAASGRERSGRWAVDPRLVGWCFAAVLYAVYLFVGVFGAGTLVGLLENDLFGNIINPWLTALVETFIPLRWCRTFWSASSGCSPWR